MKKPLILGVSSAALFAFTFILNRSMNLSGEHWAWGAALRYIFMLPMLFLLLLFGGKNNNNLNANANTSDNNKNGISNIISAIKSNRSQWLIWSTIGFGIFYAGVSFSSTYAESWFSASMWQLTIIAGVLLTPLFGKKIPMKNLSLSLIILFGIFLLQVPHIIEMNKAQISPKSLIISTLSMLVAAFAYPLGNRKMMQICGKNISTLERVFGMTLCSMPFWIIISIYAFMQAGLPSVSQLLKSFGVAMFSGVIATILFFKATDLVKDNPKQLAVIEATQAGEVIFTLLGGIILLGDKIPSAIGIVGIITIIVGMIINSLATD